MAKINERNKKFTVQATIVIKAKMVVEATSLEEALANANDAFASDDDAITFHLGDDAQVTNWVYEKVEINQ